MQKENSLDAAEKSWRSRLDTNRAEVLTKIRSAMMEIAKLERHTRSLILDADDGLLIWQVLRKTPEGVTYGLCRSEQGKNILEQYGRTLDELDKPILFVGNIETIETIGNFKEEFEVDVVFMRDPIRSRSDIEKISEKFKSVLSENARIVISQRIPKNGQRISSFVEKIADSSVVKKMKEAESRIYSPEKELFSWDGNLIAEMLEEKGFSVTHKAEIVEEKRRVSKEEIEKWFDGENQSYGKEIRISLSEKTDEVKDALVQISSRQLFTWKNEIEFFVLEKRR